MNVRTGTVLVLMAFAVTLAYYIGTRMSTEALSVAVGVVFGMIASVPVSLGLLIALTRPRERSCTGEPAPDSHPAAQPQYGAPRPQMPQAPQIIVVAPPQGANAGYNPGQPNYAYPYPGATPYVNYAPSQYEDVIEGRDWKIIGDDDG